MFTQDGPLIFGQDGPPMFTQDGPLMFIQDGPFGAQGKLLIKKVIDEKRSLGLSQWSR
jgi:hypothetical protein